MSSPAFSQVLGCETPFGKPVSWADVAMVTDIGTQHLWNDDRCLVITYKDLAQTIAPPWQDFMLCVLADGATRSEFNDGQHAGWRASQIAQGAFVDSFFNTTTSDVLQRLKESLAVADDAIQAAGEGSLSTTLTALFLAADGTACAASLGDSALFVLSPEHKSVGSKQPMKLGREKNTAVGSGETRSPTISWSQLMEQWWPNKEDERDPTRVRPGTYMVLMSDGLADSLDIHFVEKQLRRHVLERVTVGLPTYTREHRASENKRTGASTSVLGLDNMSAIVVRFDGPRRGGKPVNVPRLDATSLVCAMGTHGGPDETSGCQFGVVCLAGRTGQATAAPRFLRNLLESEHRTGMQLRLEQAWLNANPKQNQARFAVLYADDRGSSFTFANQVPAGLE